MSRTPGVGKRIADLTLLTHFQEKLDQRREEEPRVLGPDAIQRAELRAARRRRAPLTPEGDSL
jgi:hypothetical protein